MNYYAARQREKDKKWDYTCMNDGAIWPIGYCRPYRPLTSEFFPVSEAEIQEYAATSDKHHDHGHDTEEEACRCYREYLLDHRLRLKKQYDDTQHKCQVCDEWTQFYADIDMQHFVLCESHNNRDEVEKLLGTPGWSCSSC